MQQAMTVVSQKGTDGIQSEQKETSHCRCLLAQSDASTQKRKMQLCSCEVKGKKKECRDDGV